MSAPRDRPAGKILPRWRLRSAPQKTQSSLKSRLIVALLLVAWLPALIALPLHYRLIDENAGEHARRQLAQLSTVQQRRIDRELDRLIDGLALVGSRTQLRLSLDEFNRSALAGDQEFIARILADAIDSSDQISGGWVHALDRQLVAGSGPVPEPDPVFSRLLDDNGEVIFPYWRIDACDAAIWLGMPLKLNGRTIGSIVLQVGTDMLAELVEDFPDPGVIGESVIVLRRPDGARCALPATLPSGEDSAQFVQLAEQSLEVSSVIATDEADSLWLTMPLKYDFGQLVLHSSSNLQRELRNAILAGYGFILVAVAVLTTAFSIWVSRRLAAPVDSLTATVHAFESGGHPTELDTTRWPIELQILAAALVGAVTSQRKALSVLRQEIRVRRAAQKQLVDLANSDELTGLANRRYFIQHLSDWLQTAETETASLLYLDLDRFKPVNDRHGHEAGDTVLRAVAERLKNVIRDRDVAARLGGDEFAVLLLDDTEASGDAAIIAQRIEASICQPIACGEATVSVGCSIGITEVAPGMSVEAILARADQAMYRVKQQRRRGEGNA